MAKIRDAGRAIWSGRGVKNGVSLLFLVCLFAHWYDAYKIHFASADASLRIALWAFVWIVGWLLLKESQLDAYTLGFTLLLSLFSFGVPYLKGWLDLALPHAFGDMFVVFAPIWLIYLVYFYPDSPRWMQIVGTVYLVGWLIVAIIYGYQSGFFEQVQGVKSGYIDVWQPLVTVWNILVEGFKNAWAGIFVFVKKLNSTQSSYMNTAIGGDYLGTVDQNSKEKLGVYLQDIKPSQSEFISGDPVGVWATIVARTFDKPVSISVGCVADKGTATQRSADKVIPSGKYDIFMSDQEDLDCSFDPKSLAKGSHRISLLVNFTFQTMAYQKVYFMDKTRALALVRDNIDVLDYYGIKEKSPIAVYTSGPVMIGMDVKSMPIRLDRQASNQLFMLGISLKNQWEGRIVNVTGFKLLLPNFARLDNLNCGGFEFQQGDTGVYILKKTFGDVTDYRTFRCPIAITNVNDALGQTPISIQYFKVVTNYTYQLEKTISINIKESPDEARLMQETKKSYPKFNQVGDKQLARGESWSIFLSQYASDAETPRDQLGFRIVSQSRLDIVECSLDASSNLLCKAGSQDGFSEILLEVNDKVLTNTTKFRMTVGNTQQPAQPTTQTGQTTTSRCADSPDACGGSDNNAWDKTANRCLTKCEYFRGCRGIGLTWDCDCNEEECGKLGQDKCKSGYCPGANSFCCDRTTLGMP